MMPKQRATQDFVGERQQRRQFRPLPRTANAMDTDRNQNAAACMVPPHFDAANHQHAILEDAVDRI